MTRYAIQLEKIPNQQIKVTLDGKDCTLTFITRENKIYLNKLSVEEETILSGIVCLNETNILQYANFAGKLYFKDMDGNEDPNYSEFNDRFVLIYEVA